VGCSGAHTSSQDRPWCPCLSGRPGSPSFQGSDGGQQMLTWGWV
jgi:hypothetical protein